MIFHRILPEDNSAPDHYKLRDEDGRSYYLKPLRAMGSGEDTREARPGLYFPLKDPEGNQVFPIRPDGVEGRWRWSEDKVCHEAERIEWRKGDRGWVPYFQHLRRYIFRPTSRNYLVQSGSR